LQKLIARPIEIDSTVPRTPEEWKSFLKPANEEAAKHASDVARRLHVRLESGTIAGVHVFHVKPELVSERNKARLMMHVHGGAYVFLGGMAATREAILLAHYAGLRRYRLTIACRPPRLFRLQWTILSPSGGS
jgi:monoterpene epsilon-lactone hydrolase